MKTPEQASRSTDQEPPEGYTVLSPEKAVVGNCELRNSLFTHFHIQ